MFPSLAQCLGGMCSSELRYQGSVCLFVSGLDSEKQSCFHGESPQNEVSAIMEEHLIYRFLQEGLYEKKDTFQRMWLIGLQVNLFAIIFMHLDFLIFCWFETCIESFSYLHLVQTLAHYSMIHGSKDKQIVLFLCMSFLSSLNKSFLSLGTRYSRCKMMFF